MKWRGDSFDWYIAFTAVVGAALIAFAFLWPNDGARSSTPSTLTSVVSAVASITPGSSTPVARTASTTPAIRTAPVRPTPLGTPIDPGELPPPAPDDWATYSNSDYGYEIRYPAGWQLSEIACGPWEDCTHHVDLHGATEGSTASVVINPFGNWCAPRNPVLKEVVVAGEVGREFDCGIHERPGLGLIDAVVRFFPTETRAYVVAATAKAGDVDAMRDTRIIVGSFTLTGSK